MVSLKQVIGQLIITDISSPDIRDAKVLKEYEKLLIDYNIGGIMLFNEYKPKLFPLEIENQLVDKEQTKNLIEKLKNYNSNLFIAVDVEGGFVDRLKYIRHGCYKSANEMGNFLKRWSISLVYDHFYYQGKYLNGLGFNLNAAPVLDVVPSYKDKYLMASSKRSFSSDVDIVSKVGMACIKGLKDAKIISAAKHFPGLGPVNKKFDPHFKFPRINKISKKSLKPFLDAINEGVEMIMTTHLQVKKYGNKIATMNKNITDILRDNGFNGIIITDDISLMSTGLLNSKNPGPTEENLNNIVDTAYKAIKAGHDMLLVRQLGYVNNKETDFIGKIIEKIHRGVESGYVSYEQIMNSYQKVQELKNKYILK